MKNAVILFTRVPEPGFTKTRLEGFLTKQQCADFHWKLILKEMDALKHGDWDIFISYTPDEGAEKIKSILGDGYEYFPQRGENLGIIMYNSLEFVFSKGYESVILVGSDIFDLTEEVIDNGFEILSIKDMVLAPVYDGGYCLIGMNRPSMVPFTIEKYGVDTVFVETIKEIEDQGYSVGTLIYLRDIDTREDMIKAYLQVEEIKPIGCGEYNMNYSFVKDGKPQVFRINLASQMHLDNQIEYEYTALKALEVSGVTPRPCSYDNSKDFFPYGVMTMEFLEGRSLDYHTDMDIAAYLLSTVHNVKYSGSELIIADRPFSLMYNEFEEMFSHYSNYDHKDEEVVDIVIKMLSKVKSMGLDSSCSRSCIINTELNSGNFIIGNGIENSYIIDWEKPLIGDPEQDLGHFLAPTTTLWKTDVMLDWRSIEDFLLEYEKYNYVDRKLLRKYIAFNCVRGITWCAMAFVEYQEKDRFVKNDDTFEKIKSYLDLDFLRKIYGDYLEVD